MDEYIFDKRKMKKLFTKYGLIFLSAFPLMLVINFLLMGQVSNTVKLLLLVLFGGIYVSVVELIIFNIKQNKIAKQEQDVVVVKAGALNKKAKTFVNKTKTDPKNDSKN